VEGWGKIVAGVVIGVAGTVYATNEELRKRLPETARDLPDNVRRRFERAVSAAREASSRRREEILRDLERHDASHRASPLASVDEPAAETAPGEQVAAASERQGDAEGDGEETP
jgi:uncharacterized membrane protein YccC